MALPFGVTPEGVAIGGVFGAIGLWLFKFIFEKAVDWWQFRRRDKREIVKEWHSDVLEHLNRIDSVGYRAKASRRLPLEYISELRDTTVDFRNLVDPFPLEVREMVNDEVLQKTQLAAALAFNLTHIPSPPEGTEPLSEMIHHQLEILERLDVDTKTTAGEILNFIEYDDVDTEEIDVSPKQAKAILENFEQTVNHQITDADDVTVEELNELPWGSIDQIISKDARESIARLAIDQLYEIVLIEKPREAKTALKKSRQELFG